MKDRPINLLEAELRAIRAGRVSLLIRPGVSIGRCRAGDRLWIREPFHLPPSVDNFAPTAAVRLGAKVMVFAVDGLVDGIGKRRLAREMPRELHRYHLRVESVRRANLQEMTFADLQGSGHNDPKVFIEQWNATEARSANISSRRARWQDNPAVSFVAIHFEGRPL